MIEYDKADVTSSYPSLTEYEAATILDKAYNALIAQKITGNNVRRSSFESDLKSLSDLLPLIKTEEKTTRNAKDIANNVICADLPNNFLYYVKSYMAKNVNNNVYIDRYQHVIDPSCDIDSPNPIYIAPGFLIPLSEIYYDSKINFDGNVVNIWCGIFDSLELSFHRLNSEYEINFNQIKDYFIVDEHTYDIWEHVTSLSTDDYSDMLGRDISQDEIGTIIKPVIVLELISGDNDIVIVQEKINDDKFLDPIKLVSHDSAQNFLFTSYNIPWIKTPVCYIEDNIIYVAYDPISTSKSNYISISYITKPNTFVKDLDNIKDEDRENYNFYLFQVEDEDGNDVTDQLPEYIFECNDTVAEELISLAVAFALENVESRRLNTKLNMRGLEA